VWCSEEGKSRELALFSIALVAFGFLRSFFFAFPRPFLLRAYERVKSSGANFWCYHWYLCHFFSLWQL
jgi:hypothetical protein